MTPCSAVTTADSGAAVAAATGSGSIGRGEGGGKIFGWTGWVGGVVERGEGEGLGIWYERGGWYKKIPSSHGTVVGRFIKNRTEGLLHIYVQLYPNCAVFTRVTR